jgi:hypothetical protein
MESFDAYREEAYREAIRSIAPSTLAWLLDMLNRYRGPEGRTESLLEVFDTCMFTVNHPAWEMPPGTAIDLPALTSDIAARAERGSEFADVARSEIRQFREHADTYDDAELMELGGSRLPDLRILVEPFTIGKTSFDTLRSMQVRRWRTCGVRMTSPGQTPLFATSSSRTWLNAARSTCWRGRARATTAARGFLLLFGR